MNKFSQNFPYQGSGDTVISMMMVLSDDFHDGDIY
jgi:hypothetical protein